MEKVIIDIDVEGIKNDDLDKLAQLKSAIVNSQEEAAKLKTAYKNQAITLKEYGEQASFIETKQKKLNAAYTETQQKVTGLKSPFDRLKDSLGGNASVIDKMVPGLGSAASGIMGMTRAAIAFIATPLGAVLAAIALGVAAFTAALKTNDEVSDEWAVTTAQFNALLDIQYENLGKVGTALDKLIHLDLAGFWKYSMEQLDEYNNTATNAVIIAGKLAQEQNKLDDANNKYLASELKIKNEIAQLIIQSKNRSLTEAERLKINQQAADLESKQTNDRIKLTTLQSTIDLASIGAKKQLYLQLGETVEHFGNRILANSTLVEEDQKVVIAAIRAVDEAQAGSIKIQEKLQNQRDALTDAAEVKRQKAAEEKKKQMQKEFDEELAAEKKFDDDTDKQEKAFRDLKQKNIDAENKAARDKELEEVKLYNENVDAEAQAAFDKEQTRKQAMVDFNKAVFAQGVASFEKYFKKSNDLGVGLMKGFLVTLLKMLKLSLEAEIIGKAFATPDSILTFGATGAIRAAIITAGLEVAFAAAESAIDGFAEGGSPSRVRGKVGNQGVPIRRSNGDNRLVTMRHDEVVLTPQQQARVGGPLALHMAGLPGFAGGGGFETRTAFNQSFAESSLARVITRSMNLQVPVLVLEQFQIVQQRQIQVAQSAKAF